jgi:hypothetical protein
MALEMTESSLTALLYLLWPLLAFATYGGICTRLGWPLISDKGVHWVDQQDRALLAFVCLIGAPLMFALWMLWSIGERIYDLIQLLRAIRKLDPKF